MTLKEIYKRWEFNPIEVILLLTLLQIAVTLLTDGFALSFDEAMWHYIGRNWFRHGLVPYAGGVDNKSPLIFAIFGLSDWLFGVNYWFPRILGAVVQSIGIYYIYKTARHIAGERAGMLAITFYGLSQLWHGTGGRYVSFTETYDILFIVIAVYRYITAKNNKDLFISGLLAGIGLCFRLSAVFGIITILLFCIRKYRIQAGVFCTGIFSAVIVLLLVGYLAGIDIQAMFTYGLFDNYGAGSTTDRSLLWKLQNFSDKFFYSELILFYPFVLGYFFIKRKVDLFAVWLLLEFVGINIVGIYGTLHMKELLPVLSLMSAFCVNHLINNYSIPSKPVFIIVWLVFFPKLLEPLVVLKRMITREQNASITTCGALYDKPDEGGRKKLGWWIRDNTNVQDKVFVAGFGAQVQAYSERISPTIYFNVTQTAIAKERYYSDLKANEPVMILVPLFSEYREFVSADMRQFLDALIQKDYYVERCLYNYNIYRIKPGYHAIRIAPVCKAAP